MRFSTGAAAASLSLLVTGGFAATPAGTAQGTAAPAATPAPSTPTAANLEAATPAGEAAAKHAKRTACLKTAKANMLVGAEKMSFLKACVAAP